MVLLDLLGRRWTLRVLWELRDEPRTFGQIQGGEISTSVLAQRLRELTEAEIVERTERGAYALTASGRELAGLLMPVDAWAKTHLR
jgi:DNA-binding HxlR family transcriptional regulator